MSSECSTSFRAKIDDIYVKSTLISSILNVLINVLLIPRLAALGAAIASLVAESFVPLYQYFRLRSRFDYSKAVLASVPYYLIGLASALPALLVQRGIWYLGFDVDPSAFCRFDSVHSFDGALGACI